MLDETASNCHPGFIALMQNLRLSYVKELILCRSVRLKGFSGVTFIARGNCARDARRECAGNVGRKCATGFDWNCASVVPRPTLPRHSDPVRGRIQ